MGHTRGWFISYVTLNEMSPYEIDASLKFDLPPCSDFEPKQWGSKSWHPENNCKMMKSFRYLDTRESNLSNGSDKILFFQSRIQFSKRRKIPHVGVSFACNFSEAFANALRWWFTCFETHIALHSRIGNPGARLALFRFFKKLQPPRPGVLSHLYHFKNRWYDSKLL